jgi:membrane protein DedA with SNARE-associated domain
MRPARFQFLLSERDGSHLFRLRNLLIAVVLLFPIGFITVDYLEDMTETGAPSESQGIISLLSTLPTQVMEVASRAGYLGIFSLMLLEAASFPVPSEVILPFAGYLVSQGMLQFWPVVFYSTVAALIGSLIDYYVGWKIGSPLLTGQARLPYFGTAHLGEIKKWFDAHGPMAVALLRLVPTARVLISFPAGAYHMSRPKFVLYTLLGCLPWNITLLFLGWWLGSSWQSVVAAFSYINLVVYAVMILLIAWVAWRFALKRRSHG